MNAQSKPEAPTLLSALALALPELESAKKTVENLAFKRGDKVLKYADLGSVIEAIQPIAGHGIWFIQLTHENENGADVETIFIGHGEQFSAGRVFVPASRRDAHGFGSALTYARRYGLQTAFGLSTEDDDGNAAVKSPQNEMPDHEWSKLVALIEAAKANVPAMLKHLKITLPSDNIRLLSQGDYARVTEALNAKLAKLAKDETDAKAQKLTLAEELSDGIDF